MSAGDHDFAVAVDRALYSAREPERGALQPGASGLTKCIMTTRQGWSGPPRAPPTVGAVRSGLAARAATNAYDVTTSCVNARPIAIGNARKFPE